jgi:branched-chain amino acid transport system ATP-binding protein
MLRIEGLSIHYGVIPAVKNLNIEIKQGEIVTLIGANGSGKTTTLRGISGITRAKKGKIFFQGEDISQVPEGRGVFQDLKVIENLHMGAYLRRNKKEIQRDIEEVFHFFPRLEERKEQYAGTLSGGEQQMLAMGRALMSKPKLLLLDEPSMGLAPIIVKEIFKIVKRINEEGTTVLLVEQNANMALSVAHRGYVLETGEIVEQGTVSELQNNDKIRKIYLGIHG